MGSAASSLDDLPERLDENDIADALKRFQLDVKIDMVRFRLLEGPDRKITRIQALQLMENKMPPIFSVNVLCR